MSIDSYIFQKGMLLYRFINLPPSQIVLGMTQNKGKTGRCNQDYNIYYCSKSMEGLLMECGHNLRGSLIVSEVQQDICCGFMNDTILLAKLRGRTKKEPPEMVHRLVLGLNGLDLTSTYKETNEITDVVIRKFPDGMVYPSVHSMDCVIHHTIFQFDDSVGFSNIALTEQGFSKIKECPPIVYWHND